MKLSCIHHFLMKSPWLEDIVSRSLGASLLAKILEKILATLTRSVALFLGGGDYMLAVLTRFRVPPLSAVIFGESL
jgi:hypothetical protein